MKVPTLFASELGGCRVGSVVTLHPDEAGHARSLRLKPGTAVALTDGLGHRWLARFESLERKKAVCTLEREATVLPAPPIRLAFGVGNRDRTLWLVEKAVELGVGTLEPIEFSRSTSVADGARSAEYWRRARRRAIAALKQSGGSWLPRIQPVVALRTWLSESGKRGALGLLADETAEHGLGEHLNGWDGRSEAIVLVGPEGGIEPRESEWCRVAGFLAGRLGENTLRFETAAVAALALVAERAMRTVPRPATSSGCSDPSERRLSPRKKTEVENE